MFEFLVAVLLATAAAPLLIVAGIVGCALWVAWSVFKVAWGVAWAVLGVALCVVVTAVMAVGCGVAALAL